MKSTELQQTNLDEKYWSNRYETEKANWDIGYISTPIKNYIDQLTNKSISILIPGCGNAYEAAYLLENGFTNITVVDISPIPILKLKQTLKNYDGNQLTLICDDFFNLNTSFDLILEQTFFCALNPNLRTKYATKMHELLNDNGKLVGLFFNCTFENNPPFGGNKEEYFKIFNTDFKSIIFEECFNSIEPRNQKELFAKLIK